MAILDLTLKDISDPYVRENFFRVQKYIQAQAVLLANFTFFEVEITKATAKYSLAHGLTFIPRDVITLSADGDLNFYFRWQEFDKNNIYITAAGPVKLRFLAGRYSQPGYEKAPVGYSLVAPAGATATSDHLLLSNLVTGDSGHTQFALLAGRSGGQSIRGGTAASENLTLDSTAHATKGLVLASSDLAPTTDASYSGGWSGTNLGGASRNFKDIYSKGIHYGLRLDQYAGSGAYPANSTQNVGRVIWDTTLSRFLVDTGATWSNVGPEKWSSDTSWDGVTTSKTVTVSSLISDARTAIWQLRDNTNSYQIIYATITTTQTAVTITTAPALPAGSYRLIGIN